MDTQDIDQLLKHQNEQLSKLHQIVKETIVDEQLIIQNLSNPPLETISRGQKLSDKVARFGGSWWFIIVFILVLTCWILINTLASSLYIFDPYPYILMNLILSCVAALQAPIIMMSQNRQEEKDRKRSENDYLINLKAELQIRSLHKKMDLLLEGELKTLFEAQKQQFDLLKHISAKLADQTSKL
ncbi:MAG: DUF1003 domain-containing protein [Pseudosphingobacterium sp.]|jgi:uncharacterized membrane protein|uniref:DUF1003 domain-containing protein n=1 Tax=unclassified Olivibacter TaxID=2632301 RepID=UPI0011EA9C1B|nr:MULTISPECIES: DUF1003 domain-containing protein [unclassified Olivibacter]MCL4639864.1 DUF1003 domain-containing protein [Olivibacter sp. UJ_SKK_5.1]MDM8176053.1 DUF1003 domain-containing protein [Olivibacter sp. 47]MDX3917387.1 DUF1003 domain-containing protein [Pseudosphingobacterium sp.]QEL02679.1 DUF1003 domain-containing protein [Olivibacter sp. LS-1]